MADAANSMQAVVIARPGGPEVLEIREVPRPAPGSAEVLVRVRASALNRADVLQRQGRYPAPPGAPADIPGLEFAGEVAELGPNAGRWRPSQRVFGLTAGGGHAQYVVAHEQTLAEIPANLSWIQAAAIPEAFITAQDALAQAGMRPGEAVLIHAVGSGVGLAAVQLVRALGAVPYGTSRTADKITRSQGFGLADGIALPAGLEDLPEAVRRWTAGKGVDVVVDLVGGPYLAASLAVMAARGRLVALTTSGGAKVEIEMKYLLGRRLTVIGSALRGRSLEEKIQVTERFAAQVVPLLAQGKVLPVLDSEFPIRQIQDAHRRMESNASFGKIALRMESD
ncbi:MAG TPA: NAD(P)H-quinone oxidoreductase [Terriglobales bacterium]|nr:NAD(P)H-quinone oxidoreductase [Terriglobales bacterium]